MYIYLMCEKVKSEPILIRNSLLCIRYEATRKRLLWIVCVYISGFFQKGGYYQLNLLNVLFLFLLSV